MVHVHFLWHTVIISVVNSWLHYKRHCRVHDINPLKLCDYASDIAGGFIECKAKIRRSLVSSPPVKPPTNRPTKRPAVVIRKDGTNHLPIWDEKRQRCKLGGCDGFSYIKCCRCNMQQRQKLLCDFPILINLEFLKKMIMIMNCPSRK